MLHGQMMEGWMNGVGNLILDKGSQRTLDIKELRSKVCVCARACLSKCVDCFRSQLLSELKQHMTIYQSNPHNSGRYSRCDVSHTASFRGPSLSLTGVLMIGPGHPETPKEPSRLQSIISAKFIWLFEVTSSQVQKTTNVGIFQGTIILLNFM